MEYDELLKDPRWQRKRLEAMQADKFTCQMCFRSDKPLNVHHKKYIQGAAPWEYDTSDLITLCEKCHAKYHRDVAKTKIMIDTLLIISERLKAAIWHGKAIKRRIGFFFF
jgi:5-methylcytosine-specific restriction endonuclease McrA